jgi:hypothetical protein
MVGQAIERLRAVSVEITKRLRLKAIGHQPEKQSSRDVGRREPAPSVAPGQTEIVETGAFELPYLRLEWRLLPCRRRRGHYAAYRQSSQRAHGQASADPVAAIA